jgi:hypothetical protein
MENNKNVLFEAIRAQHEKIYGYFQNFNQKVDDFIRNSLSELSNAQQQLEL